MAKNGGLIILMALLLVFSGIINMNQETPTQATTQCNDQIDNDGDGSIDAASIDGQIPAETDCQFIVFNGANATNYACYAWNDETTAPTTLEECGY
jgi:hypothetical protein